MNKKVTFAALALGLALGAWGMRLYFDRTLSTWSPSQRFLSSLDQDLSLTPEQSAAVSAILASQKAKVENLRRDWGRQVIALDREGEDQIARLLNQSQTDKFIKVHDQIHSRMDLFLWASEAGPTALAIAPTRR